MAIKRHFTHIKSNELVNGGPKLPQASDIMFGEIAINYAKGHETLVIKNDEEEIVQFANAKPFVEIEYQDLKNLRDNGELEAGKMYRITDYVTTTTQENTQSANHQFDVMVIATDVDKLNENAMAILHDGDTYFENSNINAWEIKYCIDNDTDVFEWADATNGKGVIYYMKDEFDNECPYDFKNIMFKPGAKAKPGTVADVFYYTFSVVTGGNDGTVTDYSLSDGRCNNNKMGAYIINGKRGLNSNVFRNTGTTDTCAHNVLGPDSHENIFGTYCNNNSFGNDCFGNSFGGQFKYNSVGNRCFGNSFGNYNTFNSFGNQCCSNTFGNDCNDNSFGNTCNSNYFANNCYGNSFGNSCGDNLFGNNESYNSLGNNCKYITFDKNYCYYNIVEDGNRYITLTSTATTSDNLVLRNVTISQGCNNSSTYKTIVHNKLNEEANTRYQPATSEIVEI